MNSSPTDPKVRYPKSWGLSGCARLGHGLLPSVFQNQAIEHFEVRFLCALWFSTALIRSPLPPRNTSPHYPKNIPSASSVSRVSAIVNSLLRGMLYFCHAYPAPSVEVDTSGDQSAARRSGSHTQMTSSQKMLLLCPVVSPFIFPWVSWFSTALHLFYTDVICGNQQISCLLFHSP